MVTAEPTYLEPHKVETPGVHPEAVGRERRKGSLGHSLLVRVLGSRA